MAWVLKVSVEAIEVEQSALGGGPPQVKRGLALMQFASQGESIWNAWEAAEQRVTDDLLGLLEPVPASLGVH